MDVKVLLSMQEANFIKNLLIRLLREEYGKDLLEHSKPLIRTKSVFHMKDTTKALLIYDEWCANVKISVPERCDSILVALRMFMENEEFTHTLSIMMDMFRNHVGHGIVPDSLKELFDEFRSDS